MKKRWLVTIMSLLALAASVGLPPPVRAAGLYTHTEFVARAIEELKKLDQADPHRDYSKLVSILEWNGGIVNYGALFPDLGYGVIITPWDRYDAWAEVVHDSGQTSYRPGVDPLQQRRRPVPPFRAALIAKMQDHINGGNPPTGEDEKMVAFLFGLIAHQEADIPWHWNGQNYQGVEAKLAPYLWTEPRLDNVLYHYNPSNDAEFDFLTDHLKVHIGAASAAAGRPAPEKSGCVTFPFVGEKCGWDPYWLGQNGLMALWALGTTDLGPNDPINEFLWQWEWGGIDSEARLIAIAWKETWDLLTGRPEVSSVTISGPTEGEPSQYTFTAAFEPADASRPLSWEWDNGDPTRWTTRDLTAGTHTLQATAKGWEGSTLATASHTIVVSAGPPEPPPPPPQWVGSVRENLGGSTPTLRVESAIAVVVTGRPGLVVDIQSGGWTATCTTGNKAEYGPNACEFGGLRASTYTITPWGLGASVPVTVDGVGWALVQFDPVN